MMKMKMKHPKHFICNTYRSRGTSGRKRKTKTKTTTTLLTTATTILANYYCLSLLHPHTVGSPPPPPPWRMVSSFPITPTLTTTTRRETTRRPPPPPTLYHHCSSRSNIPYHHHHHQRQQQQQQFHTNLGVSWSSLSLWDTSRRRRRTDGFVVVDRQRQRASSSSSSSSSLFSSASSTTTPTETNDREDNNDNENVSSSDAPSQQQQLQKQMKHDAIEIIQSAIDAVDPYQCVKSFVHMMKKKQGHLLTIGDRSCSDDDAACSTTATTRSKTTSYDLSKDYDRVVVVAFGKASSAMATTFVQQLFQIDDDNDDDDDENASSSPSAVDISLSGVVICKDGHATSEEIQILNTYAPNIQILDAAHPVPDERSVEGARVLLEHVRSTSDPRCLVVCCISGGGSALFCSPRPPLDLDDLQAVNRLLLASGMSITEMNVVRKRLEDGKGGQLATACYPSTVVTLVLSDVSGDPLDLIASGPTVPDTSTAQDAWRIVEDYNLVGKLPSQEIIRQAVHDEQQQQQAEEEEQSTNRSTTTSTSTHPVFETSQTVLVGNNPRAVDAAATKAQSLGYQPVVLGTEIDGEAKEVAHFYVAMAKHLKQQTASTSDNNNKTNISGGGRLFNVAPTLPVALIAGGETTVTLHPDEHQNGKGGRNQELALSAAILLESSDLTDVVLASAGTDGGDGPTDAAGAVVCADTVRGSREEAMAALVGHDAYPYFDKLAMDSATKSTTGSSRHQIPPLEPPPLIRTGPTGTNVADVCVTLVS